VFCLCGDANFDTFRSVMPGLSWENAGYFSTKMTRTDLATNQLGSSIPQSYSAKSVWTEKVPVHEALYATTADSKHQSLSMLLQQADRPSAGLCGAAWHAHGSGLFVHAGDINMESPTMQVIVAIFNRWRQQGFRHASSPAQAERPTAQPAAGVATPTTIPSSDTYCTVCDRDVGVGNMEAHLAGKVHQKKAAAPGSAHSAGAAATATTRSDTYCTVCDREVGAANMDAHVAGKIHQKKAAQQRNQPASTPQPKKSSTASNQRGQNVANADDPGFAAGMTKNEALEVFFDAYCLRIEDTYTMTGDLRGLYAGAAEGDRDGGRGAAFADFKRYHNKALRKPGILPGWWNANEVLAAAPQHIQYGVEKSDLVQKHGPLQVMGLRALAERIEGPVISF
jgi:hypothetical protein